MVDETPKKIVNESLKCLTCSSLCSGDKRIFIFWKSSHNFAEIMKSAFNIDVQNETTRLLRFMTFVHLPFSVRSLDLFVASLVFMKGTSCCVLKMNF